MKNSIKSKLVFVMSLLFGLMFVNSGLNKFLNYIPMPEKMPEKMLKAMAAFNEIGWIMPLVGFAEILGGFFIIIPRTRALGVLIIFPVMVGIFLTNIVQDQSGLPIAVVFSLILSWLTYEERAKFSTLFKSK